MQCLLCGSDQTCVIWRLSGARLRDLFDAAEHKISDAALGAITPGYEIELFECRSCGFQFFDPVLAGSGTFYEEFDQAVYYPDARPEFDFALRHGRTRGASSVLDIGGGAGAFLDKAASAGMKTFGLELNAAAAHAAAKKGHSMCGKRLEDVSMADFGGGVDLITLFQVVEHVPDPVSFVKRTVELLNPDGSLIISVPNRDGLFRILPYDAANLPPHHVSRWRRRDLRMLGKRANLRVTRIGADTLYGRALQDFWLLHNRLAAAIGERPYPGGNWLPTIVALLYRKLGMRFFMPKWGLSLYGVFSK